MTEFTAEGIGPWSEIKLDIIKSYSSEYAKILSKQTHQGKRRFRYVYIDAFAGWGVNVSRTTAEIVPGSPMNALLLEYRFDEYHFIDLDRNKAEQLKRITASYQNVHVYNEDCNECLLQHVFPRVRYDRFERGLCILDPYGLHLQWKVLAAAGNSKALEVFVNFPIMDINRNVLHADPATVKDRQAERLTDFWGDDTWRQAGYRKVPNLFDEDDVKQGNEAVANAFRDRLRAKAGFRYVPDPLPMRNSVGATVYYLYFASQNAVGARIAESIFRKHRT